MSRVIVVLSIFLGAFLLFQVQPLIAKVILPKFGGGAAVWTASLLFFQTLLFAGYLYAHLLTQLFPPKKQWIVHGVVVLLSAVFLPIGVDLERINFATDFPAIAIFTLLLSAVGGPYFILASTGPLVQRWLTYFKRGALPYRLYSVSNIASLLALISFPLLVTPYFTSEWQQIIWSVFYAFYAVFMLILLFSFWQKSAHVIDNDVLANDVENENKQLSHLEYMETGVVALWLILSALGVILLVATTSAMTQNVPPVPFLWILPLSLYLFTFILCFHSTRWYVRWYWVSFFILGAMIGILMHFIGSQFDIISQVVIYASILFSGCMICHGELTRLKPNANQLTLFYLMMSLGGFVGSALITFVAPLIFDYFIEYPLALIGVLFLVATCNSIKVVGYSRKQAWLSEVAFCAALLLSAGFWVLNQQYVQNDVYSARNFYGALSVKDVEFNGMKERRLIDGTTSHGTQYLAPEEAHVPLSYYRQGTGGAIAFTVLEDQPISAGFIGLGAGALAAYGRTQDYFHFYELNPAVKSAAQTYFSYLTNTKATLSFTLGDGRVSLQSASNQQHYKSYDLLVVDAFAGDSIPQHLVTLEAIKLYFQHVNKQGIIAFHISNTHLNLRPLIVGLANVLDKEAVYFKTSGKETREHDTEWMWITSNKQVLSHSEVIRLGQRVHDHEQGVVWTDDFSPLLSVLK